ncbi:EamA family transporter [Bacillus sp. JJ722]|uniref:EamA family transporter n=1 Tax=Bacillus sp. JJ722 TaxID=3122973 RepID=UPI002FFD849D
MVPFFLFMDSMRYISPKDSSLLGCTEPLSAIVLSIVWLQTPFGMYQAIGSVLILLMVLLLAMRPSEESENKKIVIEEKV